MEDLSKHEEVARIETRDAQGHFIHTEPPKPSPQNGNSSDSQKPSVETTVEKTISNSVHYSKSLFEKF